MEYLWVVIAAVVGGGLGWFFNDRLGRHSLSTARVRADEAVRRARRDAEKAKNAMVLEAKEEILKDRRRAENDLRSRKGQLKKRESDLRAALGELDRERESLDAERRALEARSTALDGRAEEIEEAKAQAARTIEEQNIRLERVSGMTRDEARRQLLQNLRAEVRFEAAGMIQEIKDEAQRTAEKDAGKIISLAVERLASTISAERTVNQFAVPNLTQMKGRIIGQEGKNIRAFEQATGMQLILDEEAETIAISGFNPVQREISRRMLELLLKDGNIHPRRIEELHRRISRKLDEEMKRIGDQALKELDIRDVHPEMVQLLGRLRFRTSYGQNVLEHSKEVAHITGMLAAELRMDQRLAKRAGLFHDIGKAVDYEREGTHPEIGAEIGERCGEHEIVVNAIASHHEDCEVISPISVLVSAADAISGARPGARRKSVAEYIKRIERLEDLANTMQGVDHSYALQAGREIRVIAESNEVDDARMQLLASDLAQKIQSEMDYPGKIKVTVIREVRAVEVAS